MDTTSRKYETLALNLQALIENNHFAAGYKLPSIRKLSEQWHYSIDTVQKALNLLEDRGYVQPVAKSGYYVQARNAPTVQSCTQAPDSIVLEPPVNLEVADQIAMLLKSSTRHDVSPLGVAFPAHELLPIATLRRSYATVNRTRPDLLTLGSHVEPNQPELVQQLQQRFGGTVLLKGQFSLICGPEQQSASLACGNPGMASGGMGDVLSGIITALMAQGLDSFAAACCGGYLHGTAADLQAFETGERGLHATAILPHLSRLLNGKV